MSTNLMISAVFAAVSLGIFSFVGLAWDIFFRRKTRIDARMKDAFRDKLRDKVKQSGLFRDFAEVAAEINNTRPTWSMRLQTYVAQSGIDTSMNYLVTSAIAGAAVTAAAGWLLTGRWFAVPLAALIGVAAPAYYVYSARKNRMARLCRQLPEAFEVMSRALRGGQAVPTAFQVVAKDFAVPISEEFAYCFEQQHLGIPFEVAVRDLARRTGFAETQLFAAALIINRQAGGNLADVLSRLADTMRKRGKFQARIRALTGEGRMQASVLIALPIAAFVALLVLHREYVQALLDRPALIIATAVLQIVGAICIRKITNFEP